MVTGLLLLILTQSPVVGLPPAVSSPASDCASKVPYIAIKGCSALIDDPASAPSLIARSLVLRGRAKAESSDDVGAMADFQRSIALDPSRPDGYFAIADLHEKRGYLAEALAGYNRMIELFPTNPRGYYSRGKVEFDKNEFGSGIEDMSRCLELDANNASAYGARGWMKWLLTKDARAALVDLDKSIELLPKYADVFVNRGVVRAAVGDLMGSFEDADRAVELSPQFAVAYSNRATANIRLGRRELALGDFTMAIALDPKGPYSWTNRAILRHQEGQFGEALTDFDRSLELRPNGTVFRYRATTKSAMGDSTGAMADYTRAIEMDSKDASAYEFRGVLKSDLHDFTGALADFRQAISLDPKRDYASLRAFLVEARIGDRAKALSALQAVVRRRMDEKAPAWILTLLQFAAGQMSESQVFTLAKIGDAEAVQNQQCEAYFYAGWLRLLAKDAAGARQLFVRSVETKALSMVELRSAEMELNAIR
jgi:tetratricopeptide (TPR) repeat protein